MMERSSCLTGEQDWTEFSSCCGKDSLLQYFSSSDSSFASNEYLRPKSATGTDQLRESVLLYLEKYNETRHVELCENEVDESGNNLYMHELFNAGSQLYVIPSQYLWKNSYRNALLSTTSPNKMGIDSVAETASVDDGLFDDLDMHRLCKYLESEGSDPVEVMQTAEEVIEEIHGILELNEEEKDDCSISLTYESDLQDFEDDSINGLIDEYQYPELSLLDKMDNERSTALKHLSSNELQAKLKNLESSVKLLSESLLTELNSRDELLFEKEIRNTFITKSLEVQYRLEQFNDITNSNVGRSKLRQLSRGFNIGKSSELAAGRFLTTVIPYHDGISSSLDGLQILIRLLDAIKQDSSDVPSLLTNYILNALCPAQLTTRLFEF